MADGTVHPLTEPGVWIERIGTRAFPPRLPALFLDRDGTINVDTDYPSDPAEIELRPQMLPAIAAANRAGIPVVVVTNQSGIARGYFDWNAFAAVNGRVLELLGDQGVFVDMQQHGGRGDDEDAAGRNEARHGGPRQAPMIAEQPGNKSGNHARRCDQEKAAAGNR